ncbi:hypothetical protein Anas_12972 [Armadillidium nasatum]|uniref:Uncharacterized protein n=1 Tax=Armadillidium nasatum TaxID=96803 RepID=A0A5N5TBB9_9CRUS|nr:hypothetical protein Anas_12972 [Armadillidium nasatum]
MMLQHVATNVGLILDNDLSYFVKVSRLQYKFDPRVGVIVEDLKGFPNQTQIKEITCLTNYSAYDKLTFKPEISLPKPLIENHKRSVYMVGEEIALKCSTYVNKKKQNTFRRI